MKTIKASSTTSSSSQDGAENQKRADTELAALIEQVLDEANYRDHIYLTSLRDGSMSREQFVRTQMQFYFAVVFFSRPMAATAAKIPSAKLRRDVLRNVWEEHGDGEESDMHGETFLELMKRLGISKEEVEEQALSPEIRHFNTTLIGASVLDDYLVSTAMLGIIERMFADISGAIGQGIVERGWLSDERLVHYKLHAEIDVRHADEFFEVLKPAFAVGPQEKYSVSQGLRLGALAFRTLYDGLYAARDREPVVDPRV